MTDILWLSTGFIKNGTENKLQAVEDLCPLGEWEMMPDKYVP